MDAVLRTVATLAVAFSFGFIGKKLKIPAGAMVFAMIGVATFNIFFDYTHLPSWTRPLLQFFGGAMIGHSINKADVKNLKTMWAPVLMLVVSMVALNVGVALLITQTKVVTIETALFACSPGGVSDMALIADEMGADSAQVSILQLFRLVGICLTYPITFRFISKRWPQLAPSGSANPAANGAAQQTPSPKETAIRFSLTLLCAGVAGLLLNLLSMPAAFMVGGVVGSCAFNLLSKGKAVFPNRLRFFVQAASGGLIGMRMNMTSIAALPQLVFPIVIMFVTMLAFTGVCGYLMHKMTKSDLLTSFMSVTPGGVQEMSIIAQDLGCNTAQVVTMHTVRVIAVICFFPLLLQWLIGFLT